MEWLVGNSHSVSPASNFVCEVPNHCHTLYQKKLTHYSIRNFSKTIVAVSVLLLVHMPNFTFGNSSFLFLKYCECTSTPCHTDAQCVSSSTACTYNYKQTVAESPNQTKKVKVFIMMRQSNMVGFGLVEPRDRNGTLLHSITSKGKYYHLVDVGIISSISRWIERQYVQIVSRRFF